MKRQSIIISTKDEINTETTAKLYKNHRNDTRTGLIVPIDHVDYRELRCGFCGKNFDNLKTSIYYEEKFHATCVEKMLRGESNK